MDYVEIEVFFTPFSEDMADIIVAELAEAGCDSFETTDKGVKAYVPEKDFEFSKVEACLEKELFKQNKLQFQFNTIKAENWNAVWESNFEPIMIKDQLLVKAPFHNIKDKYPYVIEIEPKMSFGTGHHETTSLILELMLENDFQSTKLLDMGCGTGILAIFAHLRGSKDITAIDIDEWAYENCLENVERNNCSDIKVLLGDSSKIPNTIFDIIIANINRNVLLEDMNKYAKVLKPKGFIYFSGFYKEDLDAIRQEANNHHLQLKNWKEKKNWVACIFEKES